MDEMIKQSIEARRNAFLSSYEIDDDAIKKEIDELFQKMNKLGEECKDVMEFETKFASSPLSGEYMKLFTRMASSGKQINYGSNINNAETESASEYIAREVESDVNYLADDLTQPIRRKAREEFDSKMRDTPLGDIEQASNTISLFEKWLKNKR